MWPRFMQSLTNVLELLWDTGKDGIPQETLQDLVAVSLFCPNTNLF